MTGWFLGLRPRLPLGLAEAADVSFLAARPLGFFSVEDLTESVLAADFLVDAFLVEPLPRVLGVFLPGEERCDGASTGYFSSSSIC